jgi:Tfp pilus assembly protein PilF
MTRLSRIRYAQPLSTAVALMLCVSSSTMACSSSRGSAPGTQSPERQAQAEYDLGLDALSKSDLRGALAHAKKAGELDDSNADVQLLLSTIYIAFCAYSPSECRYPDAEKHARNALKLKSDFRQARNTLGSILINEKRYDEAIQDLRPLTDDILYNTPEIAWSNLGWAYLEKGDATAAVDALSRAVALQPACCWCNWKLGLAYDKKGDLRLAEKALTASIDTDRPECKSFADPLESRGRVRQKLGDAEGSRGDFERGCKVSPETPAGRRCCSSAGMSPPPNGGATPSPAAGAPSGAP